MSAAHVISVENVTVTFGGEAALDEVTFAISGGRFTGIIGPNGAGKTTLMRALLGLVKPDRGVITVFGHPPGKSHSLIGYVPQLSKVEPNFPIQVFDVVMMGRYGLLGLGRYPGVKDKKAVAQSLARVGIADLATKHFGSLSGGERQKVLIARALCGNPRLLLLDEPTTGVDMVAQESFFELLHALNTELGMTIMLVSHDTGVITNHVEELLCLNHKLFCHGPPSEVITDEIIRQAYGKNAELIPHHHHHHEKSEDIDV